MMKINSAWAFDRLEQMKASLSFDEDRSPEFKWCCQASHYCGHGPTPKEAISEAWDESEMEEVE